MRRSISGVSMSSTSDGKSGIPKYGLDNSRKITQDSKPKASTTSTTFTTATTPTSGGVKPQQLKQTASTSSTIKSSASSNKIRRPTKINKPSVTNAKDSAKVVPSKAMPPPATATAAATAKDVTPRSAVSKTISARSSISKLSTNRSTVPRQTTAPKVNMPPPNKPATPTATKRTISGATTTRVGGPTTTPIAYKPITPRQKSASSNQVSSTDEDIKGSHQSLEQKLVKVFSNAQTTGLARTPTIPILEMRDKSTGGQSLKSAANKTGPASAAQRKRLSTPSSAVKPRDFKKYGSYDSVQKLGRGDNESAHSHAVTGRDRVMENKKFKLFEDIEKQLESVQTDFMVKYEGLKATSPEKLKSSYKFITLVKDNECNLIVAKDDKLKVPKKIPVCSLGLFKERVKDAMDHNLATVLEKLKGVRDVPNGAMRVHKMEEMRGDLEKQVMHRLEELYNEIDILCEPGDYDPDVELDMLKRELQESQLNIKLLERQLADMKRDHIQEKETFEVELNEKINTEILSKDMTIVELSNKLKELEKDYESTLTEKNQNEAKFYALSAELEDYRQKLVAANSKAFEAETECQKRLDEKERFAEKIEQLEGMLRQSKMELDEMKTQGVHSGQLSDQELVHARTELLTLQSEMMQVKQLLNETMFENGTLKKKVENFEVEHVHFTKMREDYIEAKTRISELETFVESVENSNGTATLKELGILRAEVEKLRESESEKRRDIDNLKTELAREHYRKLQLEEHIKKDEELLDARANLINDLQSNELNNRQRCETLMVQNADKHRTIHEVGTVLNSELQTKSVEFRQLQESLREKCETLSRQEHMIRMLEQSNERNQKLRIRYEEKIARLEAEKRHLRDTIELYSKNLRAPEQKKAKYSAAPGHTPPTSPPAHALRRQAERDEHQEQQQYREDHYASNNQPQQQNGPSTSTPNRFAFGLSSADAAALNLRIAAGENNQHEDDDDEDDDSDGSTYDLHEIRNSRHIPSRLRDNRIIVRKYEK